MDKSELIKATYQVVADLDDKIKTIEMPQLASKGRIQVQIDSFASGLHESFGDTKAYFKKVVDALENRELEVKYSIFRVRSRARVRRARKTKRDVLRKLPIGTIQRVHDAAQVAMKSDLQGSVTHYVNCLTHDRAAVPTPEDAEKHKPYIDAMVVVRACIDLKDIYQPDL